MYITRLLKLSFLTLVFSLILISCSYQFEEPPFEDSSLVDIAETKFGEELALAINSLPNTDQTAGIKEGLGEGSLVLDVSEDFLIQQEFNEEKSAWELTVIIKNRHHMMFCNLMQQDDDDDGQVDIQFPENIQSKKDDEGQIWLSGDKVAIADFALELSLSSPKMCIAVPYQDASKITTEIPVETIVEKEVIKEVIKEVTVEVIVEKEVIKEVIKEVPVEVIVEKEVVKEIPVEVFVERSSSGACNRASSVSPMTGALNSLMLFGPILLIGSGRKASKRFAEALKQARDPHLRKMANRN